MVVVGLGLLVFGFKRNDDSAFALDRGQDESDTKQFSQPKPRKSKQKKSVKRKNK